MSLFKQFLSLRDKLSENLDNGVSFLNKLTGETMPHVSQSVPLTGDRTIALTDGEGTSLKMLRLYDDQGIILSELPFDEVSDLQAYATDTERWADLIDQLSEGNDAYQILGEISTKFGYTNRIQFSDVANYIQNFSGDASQQVKDALFSCTNDDGYITRNSFIAALQAMMQAANEAVNDETYDVDKSNPYVVDTVIHIVFQAVGLAISAVCTILAGTYGVIVAIIGAIIGAMCSLMGAAWESSYMIVDYSSSTNFVKGPISAIDNLTSDYVDYQSTDGNHVWYGESNGVGLFIWPDKWKSTPTGFKVNAYLYPCWDAYRLVGALQSRGNLHHAGTGDVDLRITNPHFIGQAWGDPSLQIYKNDLNDINTDEAVGASLLIDWFVQSCTIHKKYYSDDIHDFYIRGDSPQGTARDEALLYTVGRLISLLMFDNTNNVPRDRSYKSRRSLIETGLSQLADWLANDIIPNRDSIFGRPAINDAPCVIETNGGQYFPLIYNLLMANGPMTTWDSDARNPVISTHYNTSADQLSVPDCLPTDWGITLPTVNVDKIIYALISIAVITTAIAVTGTKIKKAITKKMIRKQTLRAGDLNKKRENFLANPNDPDIANDYVDSVYKYNKMAKWFGWGSYDMANGWVDSASDANYSSNSNWAYSYGTTDNLLKTIKSLIKAD